MDRFSLDELLRHGYAGGILLLTLLYVYPTARVTPLPGLDGTSSVAVGIGFVLLTGSVVYVFHRALLYRLLLYPLGLRLVWGRKRPDMIEIDLNRFVRRNANESVQKYLLEWGSQVHFLYCSVWSISLGLSCGALMGWAVVPNRSCHVLCGAAILLIAAFAHHYFLLKYDREIAMREPTNK